MNRYTIRKLFPNSVPASTLFGGVHYIYGKLRFTTPTRHRFHVYFLVRIRALIYCKYLHRYVFLNVNNLQYPSYLEMFPRVSSIVFSEAFDMCVDFLHLHYAIKRYGNMRCT